MIEQRIAVDGIRYFECGKFLAIRKWDGSRLEYKAKIDDFLREEIGQMDREIIDGQVFRDLGAVYVVGRPGVSPHSGCYEMQFDYTGTPLQPLFSYYKYTCRASSIEELSKDVFAIRKVVIVPLKQWVNATVSYLTVKSGRVIKTDIGHIDYAGKYVANNP